MRFCAVLAYDGTNYYGFQRQSDVPTIQGEVESALKRIGGHDVSVIGAGRTDAGVHASGQVIAFDLDWRHEPSKLVRALNVNLPRDIAVRAVNVTAPDFHPRYDARRRTYVYQIYVDPVRDPLKRLGAWQVTEPLDGQAMQKASQHLLGEHDFSTFGSPPVGNNPVRTVYEANWKGLSTGEWSFTITANAFLYRMVRRVVGTLVEAGRGRMTPGEFYDILAACQPERSAPPAPACGLTLINVTYNNE